MCHGASVLKHVGVGYKVGKRTKLHLHDCEIQSSDGRKLTRRSRRKGSNWTIHANDATRLASHVLTFTATDSWRRLVVQAYQFQKVTTAKRRLTSDNLY